MSQFSQPGFSQFPQPGFSQFPQPQYSFEQFQQYQQYQAWVKQQQQLQQSQYEQPVDESPSSLKETPKKKNGKAKTQNKDDEKVTRIRWPLGDEKLMTKAWVQITEYPIVANNQNQQAYWGRIEEHYNAAGPQIRRGAHSLRSHWFFIKPKVSKFNEIYIRIKSTYKNGWSEEDYKRRANEQFIEDQKTPFTYEHVWNLVKHLPKFSGCTKVYGHQAPKRTKTSSMGEYADSGSDANFGSIPEFGVQLDDDVVAVEDSPPSRPMGRDKAKRLAKIKGKGACSSSSLAYDAKKLSLVEDIAETTRIKKTAIQNFSQTMNKFYELEQKKILFLDTSVMNPQQRAEHEALCNQIRDTYGKPRLD